MSCLKCGHDDCGPEVYWIGIVSVGAAPIVTTLIPFGTIHKSCAGNLAHFLHKNTKTISEAPEFSDDMIFAVVDGEVLGSNQGSDRTIRFFPRANIPEIDLERDGVGYISAATLAELQPKAALKYAAAVDHSVSIFTLKLNTLRTARKQAA